MSNTPHSEQPEHSDQTLERVVRIEQRLLLIEQSLDALRRGEQPPALRRQSPPPLPVIQAPAPHMPVPSAMQTDPALTAALPVKPIHPVPRAEPPDFPGRPQMPGLEAMIGQRWASWLGGVVVLLGICFGLKYAWEQGWIRPSPTVRVIAAIALGIVVGGLGEWVYRKRMRGLAAALYGTAIAIVMASLFGAHTYFHPPVLSRAAAFAGVAIVAGLGIVLAVRVNILTLAVLSLLGAYLSPAILSTHEDRSVELLTYLGILAAVGWILSYLKRDAAPAEDAAPDRTFSPWAGLRVFVLACSAAWFCAWWFGMGSRGGHDALALRWVGFVYAGFLVELFVSTQRVLSQSEASDAPADDAVRLPFSPRGARAGSLDASTAMFSLLNTAAAFAAGYLILYTRTPKLLGYLAIGVAAVQGLVALASVSRRLMASSLLQVAGLLTLAVPLLLGQFNITLAWLAMAGGVALLGWQLNLPNTRRWAVVLLLLAVGRLVLADVNDPTLQATYLMLGTQKLSRWLLTTWGTAVLFHLVAWMKPHSGKWPAAEAWIEHAAARKVLPVGDAVAPRQHWLNYATLAPAAPDGMDVGGVLLAVFGTVLFAATTRIGWDGPPATLAWIVWLAPLVLLAPQARRLMYAMHAAAMAALITPFWLAADGLFPLLEAWDNTALDRRWPILNLVALNGVLLCAALVVLLLHDAAPGRTEFADGSKSGRPAAESRAVLAVWIGMVLFALLNFETWRTVDWLSNRGPGLLAQPPMVKQMAMSVLWSVLGFVGVVVGFARRIALLRYAALALLAVTLAKILLVDMANVQEVWRILSFVAVGALLLCVSFVYHRHLGAKETAPAGPTGTQSGS